MHDLTAKLRGHQQLNIARTPANRSTRTLLLTWFDVVIMMVGQSSGLYFVVATIVKTDQT